MTIKDNKHPTMALFNTNYNYKYSLKKMSVEKN